MYYTYVLLDKFDKQFYTGYSEDLQSRIKEHFSGCVKTTKKYSDLILVYYEACINKKDAMRREKQLKTGFGRGYINRRIKNFIESL